MTSRLETQMRSLRECGLNAVDARDLGAWIAEHLPFSVINPWVPTLVELMPTMALAQGDLIRAARIAWYVDAPTKYKRLLDPEQGDK